MKIFLRRYILLFIVVIALYSFLYLLFKTNNSMYLNYSLLLTILFSYSLRILDDYLDYDDDLKNNKALFCKRGLLGCLIILYIVSLVLSIVFSKFLFIIPFMVMLLLFAKYKYTEYIKVIFLPIIFLLCLYYEFHFTLVIIPLIILFITIDFILIRRNFNVFYK